MSTASVRRRFTSGVSRYGGMDASLLKRVKELEGENARLKKMYAESQMETAVIKEALAKKW